jgi:hypothetical protein
MELDPLLDSTTIDPTLPNLPITPGPFPWFAFVAGLLGTIPLLLVAQSLGQLWRSDGHPLLQGNLLLPRRPSIPFTKGSLQLYPRTIWMIIQVAIMP